MGLLSTRGYCVLSMPRTYDIDKEIRDAKAYEKKYAGMGLEQWMCIP